jgi:gamma-glutamylcyclotransferase (GGCT)/AIG2-like uncharacterized protein YtfP
VSAPPGGRPDGHGSERFLLFVYGTLRSGGAAAGLLRDAERVGDASVEGTLYDLDDYPALMLYGRTRVAGEVWSCPTELLRQLDEHEGADRGLFRRVAVMASGIPCWTYVAGPALAPRLTPDRHVEDGRWERSVR